MRVLVCGSRSYGRVENEDGTLGAEVPALGLVYDLLAGMYYEHDIGYALVHMDHFYVRHGAARGADTHASMWARTIGPHPGDERLNNLDVCSVVEEPFPADWSQGKKAGYDRNVVMRDAPGKIDLVVAAIDKPLEQSKGTAMMVQLARNVGLPVHILQKL